MNASRHSSEIPDKLFFRIGEVSRIANVQPSVLRFWESEFPSIKPRRSDSGQRVYRRKDVELILTIKQLLYEKKFTIKGARRHLKFKSRSTQYGSKPDVIDEIRSELKQIRDLLK
ncbi:MAG: MerR family transcriptional regulator [Desulfobacteraceae bacterium]|jgi:DNA-binding transcriptional MerR regulator